MKSHTPLYVKAFVILISGAYFLMLLAYHISLHSGFDFSGHLVGRDFINMYLGGNLIGEGRMAVLFQTAQYLDSVREWLGPNYPIHNWSYPPSLFPVVEALAKLPYYLAYFAWTLGGVLMLGYALRRLDVTWFWMFAVFLSPAGVWNILAGQNGYYISALLIIALQASYTNARLTAGIFWSLATIKPHLGVLALPLLVGQKRYGVILSGTMIFAVMIGGVTLRYGLEPWQQFFEITVKEQRIILETWTGLLETIIPTAFMQGRLWGLPIWAAYTLHSVVALLTFGLLVHAWRGAEFDLRDWITWFALGTYLLLPYSFVYDFVLLQVVLVLWWTCRGYVPPQVLI